MAVRQPTDIDLDRVDALIAQEEAALEPKHRASIAYRRPPSGPSPAASPRAGRTRRRTRSSSTTATGSRLWDIDGNEYVDFHLGYGAMVVGHAHPKIVEAIQKQARARHALRAADEAPRRGRGEPRRAVRSAAVAVLQLGHRGDAGGRAPDARQHRPRHHHQDRGQLPRPPRLADVLGRARPRPDRPARAPRHRAAGRGHPATPSRSSSAWCRSTTSRGRSARSTEHQGNVAGMIVEPAMMNCGVIFPEPGYLQGLKDLCHEAGAYLAFDEVKTGITLAYGGAAEASGSRPTSSASPRRSAAARRAARSARREELFRPSSTASTTWPGRSTATRSRWRRAARRSPRS